MCFSVFSALRPVAGKKMEMKCSSVISAGQVSPVLARGTLGTLPVLCRGPSGAVQHAFVCAKRVQSHRCAGESLSSRTVIVLSFHYSYFILLFEV